MSPRPARALLLAMALLSASAGLASANARLVSVTPLDGGCVSGPEGGPSAVQQWNVQPGLAYRITISGVVECANGGTDPVLNMRLNSSSAGNIEVLATLVAVGTYQFDLTVPASARCTMPLNYGTIPGQSETGFRVYRNDGIDKQAHLRMVSFGPDCSNATGAGSDCLATPTRVSTWSKVKAIYR